MLNRSVSTISDEIKYNNVNGVYNPQKAQHKATVRRQKSSFQGKKITAHPELRNFVDKHLLDGQTPEAISGRIKHHKKTLPNVSKDSIYRYLKSPYGKNIGFKLKNRKPKKKSRKVTQIQDRIFIDKRPKFIEKRLRVGDAEADFIVSGKTGKGILLTVTCRKLRVSFLEIIHDVSIDKVHLAFMKIKKRFPELKTLTLDNDILFVMHKDLEKLLKVKIYFCHPYHSWEKGSIENLNGFIRKYIPKGDDLSLYDKSEIKTIERRTNNRFMKCLTFSTPRELLKQHRQRKQKNNSS